MHAAAVVLAVDQVSECRGAVGDLVHAGALHVPAHRHHACSGRRRRADGGERLGPVSQDPRQVCERFHVVDDGRLAVQPDGSREIGRLEPRHAPVALQALDERGLLAHHVGAGAPVQHDVHREVGAADVAAHPAGLVGLVEGLRHTFLRDSHLAADVQEALRQPDRVASDEAPLDELVRVELHQQAVLVGAGLGLVAVHHEVAGPHTGRAEAPLHPCRKAGAAAPEQGRAAHFAVDVIGRALQGGTQALIAAGGQVAPERVAVGMVESLGDDAGRIVGYEARRVGNRVRRHQLSLPPSNADRTPTRRLGALTLNLPHCWRMPQSRPAVR